MKDEWYPVYSITDRGTRGIEVELPEDVVARLAAAEKEFEDVQEIIDAACQEARRA